MLLLAACPGEPTGSGPGTDSTGVIDSTTGPGQTSSTANPPSTATSNASSLDSTSDGGSTGDTTAASTGTTGTSVATTTTESSGTTESTGTGETGGSSSGGMSCASPDAIPGLILWLRADTIVADPAGVLTWVDQGPLGNDATRPASSPGAPQLLVGGLNGEDALSFNGDTSLRLDNVLALGDFTIFVAGQSTHPGEDFHMIMGPGPLNQQMRYESSSELLLVGPSNAGPISIYNVGDNKVPHFFTIDGLGDDWSLYWNGAFVSTAITAIGQWQLEYVGAWFNQYRLVANLAEIIIYDDSLVPADRDEVHCYLSDRYTLP